MKIFSTFLIIDGIIGFIITIFFFPDILAMIISICLLIFGILIPVIYVNKGINIPNISFTMVILVGTAMFFYLLILIVNPALWTSQLIYFIFTVSLFLFLLILYLVQEKHMKYT
ncbi:MAG: hypothetical protein ACTSXT_02560 [Candidatus Helarchaeota archaeon]